MSNAPPVYNKKRLKEKPVPKIAANNYDVESSIKTVNSSVASTQGNIESVNDSVQMVQRDTLQSTSQENDDPNRSDVTAAAYDRTTESPNELTQFDSPCMNFSNSTSSVATGQMQHKSTITVDSLFNAISNAATNLAPPTSSSESQQQLGSGTERMESTMEQSTILTSDVQQLAASLAESNGSLASITIDSQTQGQTARIDDKNVNKKTNQTNVQSGVECLFTEKTLDQSSGIQVQKCSTVTTNLLPTADDSFPPMPQQLSQQPHQQLQQQESSGTVKVKEEPADALLVVPSRIANRRLTEILDIDEEQNCEEVVVDGETIIMSSVATEAKESQDQCNHSSIQQMG